MPGHDYDSRFEDLYHRAYRVAFRILGHRGDAEDVAQETLARAFVHWRRTSAYPEAWVCRVSSNLAIDVWRKQRRGAPGPAASSAPVDGHAADRLDLCLALKSLSRRQREVVVLRYLADMSEHDVALALGCSAGAVKQHATRGLAALRQRLQVAGAC